jgi:hypothetical protein
MINKEQLWACVYAKASEGEGGAERTKVEIF